MKAINFLLICISIVFIAFLSGEICLFVQGARLDWRDESVIGALYNNMGPDKAFARYLGYTNEVGSRPSREDPSVKETVWPNGMRECRPDMNKDTSVHIAFVGCSYTFGEGVPGPQTMVWLLNESFPEITFDNYGSLGYSPVQCLAVVRRLAASRRYDLIVYDIINSHFSRMKYLHVQPASLEINKAYVLTPYVTEGIFGGYKEHYSTDKMFFLEDRSLLFDYLKRIYISFRTFRGAEYGSDYVESLGYVIGEMQKVCRENNTDFLLCSLEENTAKTVHEHLPDVPYLNVGYRDQWRSEYHVLNNPAFHPNWRIHAYWAIHFGRWLADQKYCRKASEDNKSKAGAPKEGAEG